MGMPATAKCPDVAISFYPFVRVDAQQSLFCGPCEPPQV